MHGCTILGVIERSNTCKYYNKCNFNTERAQKIVQITKIAHLP